MLFTRALLWLPLILMLVWVQVTRLKAIFRSSSRKPNSSVRCRKTLWMRCMEVMWRPGWKSFVCSSSQRPGEAEHWHWHHVLERSGRSVWDDLKRMKSERSKQAESNTEDIRGPDVFGLVSSLSRTPRQSAWAGRIYSHSALSWLQPLWSLIDNEVKMGFQ